MSFLTETEYNNSTNINALLQHIFLDYRLNDERLRFWSEAIYQVTDIDCHLAYEWMLRSKPPSPNWMMDNQRWKRDSSTFINAIPPENHSIACDLFREIFGPFKPIDINIKCDQCHGRGGWEDGDEGQFVSHLDCGNKGEFRPAWLFKSVIGIYTLLDFVEDMYKRQNYSEATTLADILKWSGCPYIELINHFKDDKIKHVKGCWAIELMINNPKNLLKQSESIINLSD